jgi:tetratricopeptide (TPR) repeat protein
MMHYLNNKFSRITGIFLLVFLFSMTALAQPTLTTPQPSPEAKITQEVGITKISISYHRPGVKERTIWGDLVPYGQVWRAGANENTTIHFSHAVQLNGKKLDAGKYGLHMIPTENDWTIIFSTINTGWGSFGYNESEDALRITVKPESSPFEERLSYRFDNPTNNSVTIALYWEKLRIPFKVEIDLNQVVIENMKMELRGLGQFFWQPWNQAANYCLQNETHIEEGLNWVNRSISINENFTNLRVKSGLLEKKGEKAEAEELMSKAMSIATEGELNQYGYQLLFGGKVDEAIKIFQKNVKDHPDSWNVYDSLGEGYATKGDKKKAIEYYNKALKMVKDENQKKRISGALDNLKK